MPTVIVPAAYQGPTRGAASVPVEGASVRECLDALEARYPGSAAQIFDVHGKLQKFVQLFVGEEPVGQDQLDQAVQPGDEVTILAQIGGG